MKAKRFFKTAFTVACISAISVNSYAAVTTSRVFENGAAKLQISASGLPNGEAAVVALNGGTDISSGVMSAFENTGDIQLASRKAADENGDADFGSFSQRSGGSDTVDIYVNGVGQSGDKLQSKNGVYIKDVLIVDENQQFEYADRYCLFNDISDSEKADFFKEKGLVANLRKIGEASLISFSDSADNFKFTALGDNKYAVDFVFGDGDFVRASESVTVTQSDFAEITAIKLDGVTAEERNIVYYVDEIPETLTADSAKAIIEEKLGANYKVLATENADKTFDGESADIKKYVSYQVTEIGENLYEVAVRYTNPNTTDNIVADEKLTITVSLMPYTVKSAEFSGVTSIGKTKNNEKYAFPSAAKVRGKVTPLEGEADEYVEYDIFVGDVQSKKGSYISQSDIDAIKTSEPANYAVTATIYDPRAVNTDCKFSAELYVEVVDAMPVSPVEVTANTSATVEIIYGMSKDKIKETIVKANSVDELGDLFHTVYTDGVARDIDTEAIEYTIDVSDISVGNVGSSLGEHEATVMKVTSVDGNREIVPQNKKIKIKVIVEELGGSNKKPSGSGGGVSSYGSGVVSAGSAVNTPSNSSTAAPSVGADIPQGHYAESAVKYLIEKKIINGDENGNVNLDANITRAQISKIIALILAGDGALEEFALNVTDAEGIPDWAKPYVSYCVEKGILNGYPDGTFGAEDNVSRSQLAVILVRLFGYGSGNGENLASYTDIPQNHWAIPEISKCVELGILKGSGDNTMRPDAFITTAEACTMIYRAMNIK